MPSVEHETEVVWERDPSDLEYLREFEATTRKRIGLPERYRDKYVVYGYTNVSNEAPSDRDGVIAKRMFVLKPKDASGPENDGEWSGKETPAEAVEIVSITAGEPSVSLTP